MTMNARIQLSVLLVLLGSFLVLIPQKQTGKFIVKPRELAVWASTDTSFLPVDDVARLINNETPDITLIDVRNAEDFKKCNLPGSVNIPVQNLPDKENIPLLSRRTGTNIFYSNGDELSAAALTLAAGLGYKNCTCMKGGINEWVAVIMNVSFAGVHISAKENALFANRVDAKRLFIQYNSLPDSLKTKMFVSRRLEQAKLDGGCE
jgi:rhodanese-related sulfurtransferase